ncbi:addiction module antidote protein [Sphingomonas sp.]|uniref:addiction module antidote protein n=1 Tax=Sphingomonas sp. TaxID=28214 RepID=UPI00286C2DC3|nr:addiction module antidote protein [Sphingomonas sp.]
MTIDVRPFDAAEYLYDDESQRAFLDEAADSDDPGFVARAIGVVARAKGGMLHLERLTGIKRQTLTKSFGPDGNPTLSTLMAVLKALDIRVRFEHVSKEELPLA